MVSPHAPRFQGRLGLTRLVQPVEPFLALLVADDLVLVEVGQQGRHRRAVIVRLVESRLKFGVCGNGCCRASTFHFAMTMQKSKINACSAVEASLVWVAGKKAIEKKQTYREAGGLRPPSLIPIVDHDAQAWV